MHHGPHEVKVLQIRVNQRPEKDSNEMNGDHYTVLDILKRI